MFQNRSASFYPIFYCRPATFFTNTEYGHNKIPWKQTEANYFRNKFNEIKINNLLGVAVYVSSSSIQEEGGLP